MNYREKSLQKHYEWKGKIESAYRVPVSSKEELSKAVGLNNISSIGIKSIGGANKIINMMKEEN